MAPVLTGREHARGQKTKGVAYRGPPELVERIDQAAADLNLSRNEAMTQLLKFALDAHEKEIEEKKAQHFEHGPGAAAKPREIRGPGAAAKPPRK